ncbi:MBL fold metallo-hydrolase [Nocardia stercoris]|uniref:Metallo-beta-lactamase domain-containing protein n=1 Tax=Nocardia stercoris TaxID=2483361 RepID=A0A3M2KW31_9NOCA|nr:MBL fold metallo-hydrolase [Nocardia stercoris]RMI29679.1 hypothetical protein EBN03_25105 [Nocardia stercoris]
MAGTIRRLVAGAAGVAGLSALVRAAWDVPEELGATANEIAPVAAGASSYRDRKFHNTEPSVQLAPGSSPSLLTSVLTRRNVGRPPRPVPLVSEPPAGTAGALAVTWYGHASALLEVDGFRVLTDPVWSERVSPSQLVGPARLHPVPLPLTDLPPLDAIVISHDHYDHLDLATVRALTDTQDALFVVPLGIGAHLRKWRVPAARIVELDWGTSTTLNRPAGSGADALVITCTEARHFSGRGTSRNLTQWASWVISGPRHRAYFGGDTGYTKAFAEIGANYGPFDLTLLPVGAYDEHWPDIHMNPEEAVAAHADVCVGAAGYGVMVPIHWATFNLAFHPWVEPIRRMRAAAQAAGTRTAVPLPGQRLDIDTLSPQVEWWEDVDKPGKTDE